MDSNYDLTEAQSTEDIRQFKLRVTKNSNEFDETVLFRNVTDYHPVRCLGKGAYGDVWLAQEKAFGERQVAIKFFTRGTFAEELSEMIKIEGDRGVIPLIKVYPDATIPFYVMAFAKGGSLQDQLDKEHKLPVPRALAIFETLAVTLSGMHKQGIVHCDIKPANVLLDNAGNPLLSDFGQAHVAGQKRVSLGTYFFMPPEQANTQNSVPDDSWDIYALGAVFYSLITGELPRCSDQGKLQIRSTTDLGQRLMLYQELLTNAPAPSAHYEIDAVDSQLEQLIDRCLALDPKDRFQSIQEVLDVIRKCRDHSRYQKTRELAKNSLGMTILAKDRDKNVVIKYLACNDHEQLKQFATDFLKATDEPGSVNCLEFQPDGMPPYVVMDHMSGGSLEDRLTDRPMPAKESVELLTRIAEVVAHHHQLGLTHNRLNPNNILFDGSGNVTLSEFGQFYIEEPSELDVLDAYQARTVDRER